MAEKMLPHTKIERTSAAEQVFVQLKKMILDGTFVEGEKFPSENELADSFGVNRLTVRLALQRLINIGVLETRVGSGTYVKKFSLQDSLSDMREFLFSDQERDDINHLRALLEVECCRLACLNATDAELEKLCRTAEEFCRNEELLIEESDPNQAIDVFDEILDCDVSFHHQLYIMSGNKLYINLFFLMEDAIRNNLKWHIKNRIKLHEPLITADRHLTIAQALVKRDFETCKELYPLLVGVEE